MPARPSRGARTSYIHVEGSDDFEKFVRSLGSTRAKWLKAERAFYVASARTVKEMAKGEARSEGSVMAKSAADVRTGTPGTVVYGGQGYNMGAEFGSYRYKQFQTWRGNSDDAGYFLWPSIRLFRDKRFQELWTKEVWRVVVDEFKH